MKRKQMSRRTLRRQESNDLREVLILKRRKQAPMPPPHGYTNGGSQYRYREDGSIHSAATTTWTVLPLPTLGTVHFQKECKIEVPMCYFRATPHHYTKCPDKREKRKPVICENFKENHPEFSHSSVTLSIRKPPIQENLECDENEKDLITASGKLLKMKSDRPRYQHY